MSDEKQLTVAEVQPPQQLITIEPAKYVELVFEPFAKRLADAKTLAEAAQFDVTTTAGMAVAVKYRATFREIRVASEKARKERKAPILEIGKLLDSRQKEIEAEIEPFESRFDAAIKAEESRKEAEKAAKLAAEQARIAAIRSRIDVFRNAPAEMVGKSAQQIGACADHLSETVIALEEFEGSTGEAIMARNAAVTRLREMQAAQAAHEAEQTRLAAERAQLERERAAAAERERMAAEARAEQERKDREAREVEDALVDSIWKNARRIESNTAPYILKTIGAFESMAKDWESDPRPRVSGAIASAREEMKTKLRNAEEVAAREAHEAELRQQREAEEAKLAEARREIERQQAEIAAAKAEQERREREARKAAEAKAAADKLEADHAEALVENARIDAERAEAKRQADEAHAAEQERIRRARAEFEATGPEDWEIVQVVADHYDVSADVARHWLARHVWMEKAA